MDGFDLFGSQQLRNRLSEDSGVDAGSNESNESVCMSFASSSSDFDPDLENEDIEVNRVQNRNINALNNNDNAINVHNLLPNNFVSNSLETQMQESSYMPISSLASMASLASTSTSSTSSLSIPSIASHSRHESLPSSSRDTRMALVLESHFDNSFLNVSKRDSLKYGNNIECECDIIAVPNDYYYNNEEQHDYCPKMRASRQRKHETKSKHISRDIAGERMLRRAANSNDIECVQKLLNDGINPQSCDERNRTALHFAACKGNTQIARILLEKGANPNQKDVVGNTALHLAVCTNNIEVITLLLTAGTDINSLDNSGRTPLHLAQSKLKMLQSVQRSNISINSNQIKNEVLQVVQMMSIYLQRSGKNAEVELLSAFTNRLHLHQTREEVDSDVKDLLTSLSHLTL